MDAFAQALVSPGKNPGIPEEDNLFGPMVGEWTFRGVWYPGTEREQQVDGRWVFSWVLQGTAVQDVYIWPLEPKGALPWEEGEYGSTMRIYNPETRAWDVFYGHAGGVAIRLEAVREGDEVVLRQRDGDMRWVFSDVCTASFHWRTESKVDGAWRVRGYLDAQRKQ